MSKEETSLVPAGTSEIAKKLNDNIFKVLSADGLTGFEKAYTIAFAAGELKSLLSAEYMKPIMDLQGNRLGFRTDKDSNGGYSLDIVKNCLIEATLTGVQPFGNQFNIIAGNCYITKEGFGHLLKKIPGLTYDITFELPRINSDKTSAAIKAIINWTYAGPAKDKTIEIPVKMNQHMGTDAVIGKATRKARAWLFQTITGNEIGDGDVTEDGTATIISSTPKTKIPFDKELERATVLLTEAKDHIELKNYWDSFGDDLRSQLNDVMETRYQELEK
jgi:hypothetical protein